MKDNIKEQTSYIKRVIEMRKKTLHNFAALLSFDMGWLW